MLVSRKAIDERRSNLAVVRSEDERPDNEIGKIDKEEKFIDKFEKR